MKRTDRLTNLIALLLFVGFLAYMGVYLFRALNSATVTAEAVAADIQLSSVASGLVVRQETLLRSSEKYIDVTASEGEKISGGAPIATAVRTEAGLERANRLHELEQEILRVSSALREMRSADDVTSREESLTTASRDLAAAAARHDPAVIDSASLNMAALLLGVDDGTVSAGRLEALQQELYSIRGSSSSDSRELTAEEPGVFSSTVDGYEFLSPADLDSLTPSGLTALIDSGGSVPSDAYGKLVTDYQWYFAAVMNEADAGQLSPGQSATLSFGRWYSADVTARVVSVSAPEDGSVAVVFRCDTALAETLGMRTVSADVVFAEYSGIRIPSGAVRTDSESGSDYVWAITAMVLERKEIEILYTSDEFVIVASGASPNALRDGNTVVVSGRDLREGRVME